MDTKAWVLAAKAAEAPPTRALVGDFSGASGYANCPLDADCERSVDADAELAIAVALTLRETEGEGTGEADGDCGDLSPHGFSEDPKVRDLLRPLSLGVARVEALLFAGP